MVGGAQEHVEAGPGAVVVAAGGAAHPVVAAAGQPHEAHDAGGQHAGQEPGQHDRGPAGERHRRGHQDHGVHGRGGQHEGHGGGRGHAPGHQPTGDRHRPALAARQGDAGGGRHRNGQHRTPGERPGQHVRRHVGGDGTAHRHPQYEERQGLHADGDEDRGPALQRRQVQGAGQQRPGRRRSQEYRHQHGQIADPAGPEGRSGCVHRRVGHLGDCRLSRYGPGHCSPGVSSGHNCGAPVGHRHVV